MKRVMGENGGSPTLKKWPIHTPWVEYGKAFIGEKSPDLCERGGRFFQGCRMRPGEHEKKSRGGF
jgi:hypothetical protein